MRDPLRSQNLAAACTLAPARFKVPASLQSPAQRISVDESPTSSLTGVKPQNGVPREGSGFWRRPGGPWCLSVRGHRKQREHQHKMICCEGKMKRPCSKGARKVLAASLGFGCCGVPENQHSHQRSRPAGGPAPDPERRGNAAMDTGTNAETHMCVNNHGQGGGPTG